jgi:hypothetical protein
MHGKVLFKDNLTFSLHPFVEAQRQAALSIESADFPAFSEKGRIRRSLALTVDLKSVICLQYSL